MHSRVENIVRNPESESQLIGEPTGEFQDVILFFGIIDILQEYSMRKKMEHAYKSIKYNPLSISVVEPRFYSERFLKFIHTVFPQNLSI
jgi:1-phosphatidylinositol-4-phosphate 5-kinase